ncbi:MAG: hypothetical protein ACJ8GV_07855 [Luteimonas sp.]
MEPPPSTPTADAAEPVVVESRWPIAVAILASIALSVGLRIAEPDREALGPAWLIGDRPGRERLLVAAHDRRPPEAWLATFPIDL